jgi:hypothetical protein
MSALLQTCLQEGGAILVAGGTSGIPIDHYHNGLPFSADGLLCTEGATPAYYHQGLPFSAGGRLCTSGGNATRFSTGSAGFGTNENMAVGGAASGAIVAYTHGVGYVTAGRWRSVPG